MARWHRWWCSIMVVVWLGCMIGCADDSGLEDKAPAQDTTEPTVQELGLRLAPSGLNLDGLAPEQIAQVALGSYLVNGACEGCDCHTTSAGYLAGGFEFALPFADVQGFTSVISRNLTPDAETGLHLSEDEFIESIRTGKDFHDSTATDPQQMLVMPWHAYRFMARTDLQAIYAFLRRIPPIRHAVRETFITPFPLPPLPAPALPEDDSASDPAHAERGVRIPALFSTGPAADTFVARFNAAVAGLTPAQRAQVGRGSYVVNALADCSTCHTDGNGDGMFDGGLLPGSVAVNTAAYLAGGVDIGSLVGPGRILARNLTPDPTTGLYLTEEQFIATIRFGADFRRPGGSLRVPLHFPSVFHLTRDDLQAIYAYLRAIPAVVNAVDIVP